MKTRAIRRSEDRRKKKYVEKRYWGGRLLGDARRTGKAATTPHPMQCDCCCNQRRIDGQTKPERLNTIEDQLQ